MAATSGENNFSHIVISVALSLIGGLGGVLTWSLADLRAELKTVLTIREHVEFKDQVTKQVIDLTAKEANQDRIFVTKDVLERDITARNEKWAAQSIINKQAVDAFLQIKSFEAWKDGMERATVRKQQADDEHVKAMMATIELLRKQVGALEAQHKP